MNKIQLLFAIINLSFISSSSINNKTIVDIDTTRQIDKVMEMVEEIKKVNDLQIELDRDMAKIKRIMLQDNPKADSALVPIILNYSRKYSMSIELLCAMISHETARSWNPSVVSPAGAIGLMQVMPKTGKYLLDSNFVHYKQNTVESIEEVLKDPRINIDIGCFFFNQLLIKYNNRTDVALAHYNGGGRAAYFCRIGQQKRMKPETIGYIPSVIGLWKKFEKT